MSNILAFQPIRRRSRTENITALLQVVAENRRPADDVFWLKENAEVLNILAAIGCPIEEGALDLFGDFFTKLDERIRFYPQYYRFLLSICLDLEDLGLAGGTGQKLCDWVADTGLAEAELSDLQRAEARRLLARRGAARPVSDGALGARLRAFVERSETFALPNKKAAYELTHIVFYLSNYGRRDPELGPAALQSLEFAGLIAYLDQNHDLLAEICTAMRFMGATPSPIWAQAVAEAHAAISPSRWDEQTAAQDALHTYLVSGWASAIAGTDFFSVEVPQRAATFLAPAAQIGALRSMSECLLDLGDSRGKDWSGMRDRVTGYLSAQGHTILQRAEASSDKFDAFFEGFSRARRPELMSH